MNPQPNNLKSHFQVSKTEQIISITFVYRTGTSSKTVSHGMQ